MMICVLFHVFDVDVVNIILLCLLYKHRKVLMAESTAEFLLQQVSENIWLRRTPSISN
jgi:hypothetical protein